MKEEILKGLKRSLPMILFLDIGFGVGPINWTIKGIHSVKIKIYERKLKKELKEREVVTVVFNEEGTRGYVYTMKDGLLVRSYFNENIEKPYWAKLTKKS